MQRNLNTLIEPFARMDEQRRKVVIRMTLVLTALGCYRLFADAPLRRLQDAQTLHRTVTGQYTDLDTLSLDLQTLRPGMDQAGRRMEEIVADFWSEEQAQVFFEQIHDMAAGHRLRLTSTSRSKPNRLLEGRAHGWGDRLWVQQAEVVVVGHYYDIVAFLTGIVDQAHQVFLSDLRVNLPPGEDAAPRASFRVGVVTDVPPAPGQELNETEDDPNESDPSDGSQP